MKTIFWGVADATSQAPKPYVNDTLAQRLTVGDSFQLNCSVSYFSGTLVNLSWSVASPQGIDVSCLIPSHYLDAVSFRVLLILMLIMSRSVELYGDESYLILILSR